MRTYSLLFKMPTNEELFCSVWAAVCTYDKRLRDSHFPVHTTLIAKETWLTKLLIPPMTFLAQDVSEVARMNFDLVVDMSDDRALDLMSSGKTAACIYGSILGLESVNELVHVKVEKPIIDIGIMYWNDTSVKLIEKVRSTYDVSTYEVSEEKSFEHPELAFKSLSNCKIIFGRRSIFTYLLASANRTILEGYSLEDYDKTFLCKWNNQQYHMLNVQKKEDLDQNMSIVWRSLERLIPHVVMAGVNT